ncbi:MAG: DUF4392 domain-containing protein [Truepera sp.]|nr:DUF4392 domain-containing protein [Truepera sp.]
MSDVNPIVAAAVGENLDALVTLDLRGYHVGRILYRAARAVAGEPLTLGAARAILENTSAGDTVMLTTGFPFLPYGKPELDGLIGTAVVARALDIALGAHPVIVTEAATVPVMSALMTAAGLNLYETRAEMHQYPHSGAVIPFTADTSRASAQAEEVLGTFGSKLVIAIEKPGANGDGAYLQGNCSDVSNMVAKTDALFELAHARGLPTIAIGDLGNEVGFGALAAVVDQETPFGTAYVGAPTDSIAAVVEADHILVGSVSDWAAYGLAAMIAFLTGNPDALHTPAIQRQLLWTAVHCGALDGSGRAEPAVDGVGEDFTARLVATMRDVLEITSRMSRTYATVIDRLNDLDWNRRS